MVCNLCQADEAESHAESKKTSAAGNVRNPAHLFSLTEPLGVRLLDEDVDNGQVLPVQVQVHSINKVLKFLSVDAMISDRHWSGREWSGSDQD